MEDDRLRYRPTRSAREAAAAFLKERDRPVLMVDTEAGDLAAILSSIQNAVQEWDPDDAASCAELKGHLIAFAGPFELGVATAGLNFQMLKAVAFLEKREREISDMKLLMKGVEDGDI